MIGLAALLLLLGAASATTEAYPAAEVWAAVEGYCASSETDPTNWQVHSPEPGSSLHYMAKPTRDRDYKLPVFKSKIAGRTIYMFDYRRNDQKWCWAYDFEMLDAPIQSQWVTVIGGLRSINESEFITDFRFSMKSADAAIISQRPGYTPHAGAVGFHGLQISQTRRL